MPAAMRPGLTLREALLNSSEFLGENAVYRAWSAVIPIMRALKKRPIPTTRRGARYRLSEELHRQCTVVVRTDAITSTLRENGHCRHDETD
jgi:hypothetical protein